MGPGPRPVAARGPAVGNPSLLWSRYVHRRDTEIWVKINKASSIAFYLFWVSPRCKRQRLRKNNGRWGTPVERRAGGLNQLISTGKQLSWTSAPEGALWWKIKQWKECLECKNHDSLITLHYIALSEDMIQTHITLFSNCSSYANSVLHINNTIVCTCCVDKMSFFCLNNIKSTMHNARRIAW